MSVYKIVCKCAVHREREHTFYVDREMVLQEAREWLVKKIGVYADTSFVCIYKLKVESVKMAKRKIHQIDHTTARGTLHTVKVYRDPEYNEYVVMQWSGDVLNDSEYFTTDKQDALDTAEYIIERIKRQFA